MGWVVGRPVLDHQVVALHLVAGIVTIVVAIIESLDHQLIHFAIIVIVIITTSIMPFKSILFRCHQQSTHSNNHQKHCLIPTLQV